jgi:hypothetical protein
MSVGHRGAIIAAVAAERHPMRTSRRLMPAAPRTVVCTPLPIRRTPWEDRAPRPSLSEETLVLADYNLGDALLTTLAIFFLVIWIWILIAILTDLFRDHELSGGLKAVWAFCLIFFPFITAFVYLIARGRGMRERSIRHAQESKAATDDYIRSVAASPVDELAKLNDLRQQGAISQEEYDRLKAKVVG